MNPALLSASPFVQDATIGLMEMVIILVVVLIVFGANRLPALGDSLGKSIKNFKKAVTAADETAAIDVTPKKAEIAHEATAAEAKAADPVAKTS
jgi:sec-independent protein translocase protein TatA